MGRAAKVAEMASIARAEPDLSARVVYFPVRHNSPACSWQVTRLIRDLRPDAVLIEGPSDATPLIPLLTHEELEAPIAIFATYVQRHGQDPPVRHSAYYPMCDYSPELAAIRTAHEVGARAEFIDLSFPESVEVRSKNVDGKVQSLLDERYFRHSRFLQATCQRAGVRDPDDLWDHLYEDNYVDLDTAEFVRNVLGYCALARQDYTPEMLEGEGCLAREAAMATHIAGERGRVVVVTGGFHTVALPQTKPRRPKRIQIADNDTQTTLIRYTFEQLDRLNGYASGMPSPEFYQRLWEGRDVSEVVVKLGASIRKRGGEASTEDEISALAHARRLARLRGHSRPSREDVLDGIRSVFVKGAIDVEGVVVLTQARRLLAGDRIGEVPAEAGQPPLVTDFGQTAARLRIDISLGAPKDVTLDLYRKAPHREISRFFHRLRFLDVRFGEKTRGPDFVTGENLDRVQEVWGYRWSPDTEATLIERSVYGSTLEEASVALLLERFEEAERAGQGRRSDVAAALLLEACRMGLHRHVPDLLDRTGKLISEDALFTSLVQAIESILVLHLSSEPLEAHSLEGLGEMAEQAFLRACYLLPSLAATSEVDEEPVIDALNAFSQVPVRLADLPEQREMLWDRLSDLVHSSGGNTAVQGGASGLLFDEGQMQSSELVGYLRGHLVGRVDDGAQGVSFLRGLLRTARSVLWQVPEIVEAVNDVLSEWDESEFVEQLPNLRLAFSDLTPRECSRVAREIAVHVGGASVDMTRCTDAAEGEMIAATQVNRHVLEALKRDGLEAFVDG